jgi:spore coat protein U-like protein
MNARPAFGIHLDGRHNLSQTGERYSGDMKGRILQSGSAQGKSMSRSLVLRTLAVGSAVAIAAAISPVAHAATATATFQVQIDILKSCAVTAGAGANVNVGSVASTATNSAGSNTISVNCTKSTPYFIGLAPSAANGGTNSGSGAMASTGGVAGNTDKVAYQLRSTAGVSGTVWGNTATTSTVGNGVAGTGNGSAQSHTVYATVPSANFTADSYADTVTVTVNY